MSGCDASIERVPRGASGTSSIAYMRSAAAMPFIAVWKNEPNVRSGRKNSADRNTMENAVPNATAPAAYSPRTMTMPTAAPPNANRSMMVMELSCIRRRRMVARRKPSACSFIRRWRSSSAR